MCAQIAVAAKSTLLFLLAWPLQMRMFILFAKCEILRAGCLSLEVDIVAWFRRVRRREKNKKKIKR